MDIAYFDRLFRVTTPSGPLDLPVYGDIFATMANAELNDALQALQVGEKHELPCAVGSYSYTRIR